MIVTFDDEARREFLTGFHKRKLARTEAAKKRAVERQKQERLFARREQRRLLRERAAENAALVEKACGARIDDDSDDGEVWIGISPPPTNQDETEQFEDDEHLATVTIVEDFDPDILIHDPPKAPQGDRAPARNGMDAEASRTTRDPRKSRPKKVHYQTSSARNLERSKQRARRIEKAEFARGKKKRSRTR